MTLDEAIAELPRGIEWLDVALTSLLLGEIADGIAALKMARDRFEFAEKFLGTEGA